MVVTDLPLSPDPTPPYHTIPQGCRDTYVPAHLGYRRVLSSRRGESCARIEVKGDLGEAYLRGPLRALASDPGVCAGSSCQQSTEAGGTHGRPGASGSSRGISDWDGIRLILAFWSTKIGAGSLLLPRTGAVLLPSTKPLHYSNSLYREGVYPLNQALNLISFDAN